MAQAKFAINTNDVVGFRRHHVSTAAPRPRSYAAVVGTGRGVANDRHQARGAHDTDVVLAFPPKDMALKLHRGTVVVNHAALPKAAGWAVRPAAIDISLVSVLDAIAAGRSRNTCPVLARVSIAERNALPLPADLTPPGITGRITRLDALTITTNLPIRADGDTCPLATTDKTEIGIAQRGASPLAIADFA